MPHWAPGLPDVLANIFKHCNQTTLNYIISLSSEHDYLDEKRFWFYTHVSSELIKRGVILPLSCIHLVLNLWLEGNSCSITVKIWLLDSHASQLYIALDSDSKDWYVYILESIFYATLFLASTYVVPISVYFLLFSILQMLLTCSNLSNFEHLGPSIWIHCADEPILRILDESPMYCKIWTNVS